MRFKKILAAALALLMLAASIPAYAETTPYYITVDIANQIVTVYKSDDKTEAGIVRQMICSTGKGNATPIGVFTMCKDALSDERTEWHYFKDFDLWGKYVSRIKGNYMFHSILFSSNKTDTPTWGSSHSLGTKASHGCIRLRVDDAKWIAEHCFEGTVVNIYEDGTRDEALRRLLLDRTFSADEETYDSFKRGALSIGKGSDSELVKLVQEKLNDAGFSCGTPDGKFGDATASAIESWQEAQEHEPTGTLNFDELISLTKMLDVDLEGMLPKVGNQDARDFNIKQDVEIDGIQNLQEQLSALGYGSIRPDGIFGDSTRDAVIAYQNANGMEETGELTIAEYEEILALTTPEPQLMTGSSGDEVRQLQEKLREQGYLGGKADGFFGENTAQALRKLQADRGYEATGKIAPSEIDALLAAPTATAPAPTSTPAPELPDMEGDLARVRTGEGECLNLRAEANVRSKLVGALPNDTIVKVIALNPGWWSEVETQDGLRGWAYTEYLEIIKSETEDAK